MADVPANPPPRRRRKEARPAELLEAALEVFCEKGFAAARMDDVAARAGVAKGTLYLYFPSKEDIFKALVKLGASAKIERLEILAASHQGTMAELLRQILLSALLLLRHPRALVLPKLILTKAGLFPELALYHRQHLIERVLALMAGIHRRGVEAGEFRPADSLAVARLCVAPIMATAVLRSVFTPPGETLPGPDLETMINTHIDVLLHGLMANGETKT
jgi:AcrR family transcriptional regulator